MDADERFLLRIGELMERQGELRDFFAALSDESRLRVAAAMVERARRVRELADELALKDAAVVKHVGLLVELGLARAEYAEGVTRYRLDVARLRERRKVLLAREQQPPAADHAGLADDERVILARFLDGERLKEIPADRGKRTIVLNWLAEQFEHERRYPEREVNEIIKRHHEDASALRRYMVEQRLMQRENGVYWRIPE